jgi:hypothetical protein
MTQTLSWGGPVVATRDQALFTVFNNESTDPRRSFTVKRINITPLNATTTTPGTWHLKRITAASGGGPVQVVAANSANQAAFDSNIEVTVRADVTEDTEVFRSYQPIPYSTQGLTLLASGKKASSRTDTGCLWDGGGATAGTQTIKCNDGEGFGIVVGDTVNMPINAAWHCTLTLKYDGDTYYGTSILTPVPKGQASLAIMNNTGASGTYLEIVEIQLLYIGQPSTSTVLTDSPLYRYCRVSGISGGDDLTPVQHDTSDAIPSALVMRKNRVWNPLEIELMTERHGLGQGELLYPEQNAAIYRRIGMFRQVLMNTACAMAPGLAHAPFSEFQPNEPQKGISFYKAVSAISGIVLKSQQGLAVIVNNPTPYCAFWLDVEVTHSPPPASADLIVNMCE